MNDSRGFQRGAFQRGAFQLYVATIGSSISRGTYSRGQWHEYKAKKKRSLDEIAAAAALVAKQEYDAAIAARAEREAAKAAAWQEKLAQAESQMQQSRNINALGALHGMQGLHHAMTNTGPINMTAMMAHHAERAHAQAQSADEEAALEMLLGD